jgi:cyclopropane fatty-acyl-phospholipid synthase-like methyltransferase
MEHVFRSMQDRSLTSLCTIQDVPTQIYFCHDCGHVQTLEVLSSSDFYNHDYKISLDTEADDQLYGIVDGKPVYRCENQAQSVLKLFNLKPGSTVLDYGCAKGLTSRHLQNLVPDISVKLYDISEMYVPYWERFSERANWAVYEIPSSWQMKQDLVLSFFAAEHICDLNHYLSQMEMTLKPGGWLMFTVPNWQENPADMLVIDHVNHFTISSLFTLMYRLRWTNISINTDSHKAALTITAQKSTYGYQVESLVTCRAKSEEAQLAEITQDNLKLNYLKCLSVVDCWELNAERIQQQEANLDSNQPIAIYGSGFYGAYVYSNLRHPERVTCFLDANPHQQTKTLFGKPIYAPEYIPAGIDHLFVGLNPQHAREAIHRVSAFQQHPMQIHFLEKVRAA